MGGREVRRIRKSLGLTQGQFAERLGVHKVTVAKWETDVQGMRGPAARLIRLLGTFPGQASRKPKGTRKPARPGVTGKKATG